MDIHTLYIKLKAGNTGCGNIFLSVTGRGWCKELLWWWLKLCVCWCVANDLSWDVVYDVRNCAHVMLLNLVKPQRMLRPTNRGVGAEDEEL